MALDGAFLACLRQELLEQLPEARVDKIHQPGKEELVLQLRHRGGSDRLYISAKANSPRLHITTVNLDNPPSPPMFCMLLRKRLGGGRLMDIRQDGWERALYLDFDCLNELGDVVRLTLAVEIMGRHSNIILVDEKGLVVDAIKRVDMNMSSIRPVLPGLPYSPPPRTTQKLDLSQVEPEEVVRAVAKAKPNSLDKALLDTLHGLSPLICRELAYQTLRGADLMNTELSEEQWNRLAFYLRRVKNAVLTGENRVPYSLTDLNGRPMDFSFIPITQYGLSALGREAESFSALLDAFFAERDAVDRLKQRSQDLLKLLTNATDRIQRKLAHQRQELANSTEREQWRLYGDLITANLHAISRGAESAELINYYDPDCATVRVPLDPALTPAQNAQKYYKLYRKAQTAEEILTRQIAAGEEELKYLDSVFDALSRAKTYGEVEELRQELAEAGYLRPQQKRQKPPAPSGPMTFISDDGFTIYVGRNNLQNDRLTLKTAKGSDIWLHTKNIPGAHTVIITNGVQPPDRTLEQAAILAATYSKAANSSQVPVDYTYVRHVRKPAGAKPGMVIYDHHKTAYVTPDPALAARLAK